MQLNVLLLEQGTLVAVCVHVCLLRVVNEADVFALLKECVVSQGPISPQPRAWLQGLGRTASTDEFVSVIKAHCAVCTGTPDTHTHPRTAKHTLLLKK